MTTALWPRFEFTGFPTGSPNISIINKSTPGSEDNAFGYEGGRVVLVDDDPEERGFHLFSQEMYGLFRCVCNRIGYWYSKDGLHFSRRATLVTSSNGTNLADPRGALAQPSPVWNGSHWHLFYTGYHSHPNPHSPSSVGGAGHILNGSTFHMVSRSPGRAGIAGPWRDLGAIWNLPTARGMYGLASFSPYQLANGSWCALVCKGGVKGWPAQTGFACSESGALEGPWRLVSDVDPIAQTENPVVTPLPGRRQASPSRRAGNSSTNRAFGGGGGFVGVLDTTVDRRTRGELEGFGMYYSADGTSWPGQVQQVRVPGGARTPMGMLDLGGGNWRAYYTYIWDHRHFYPYPPAIEGFFEAVWAADFRLVW